MVATIVAMCSFIFVSTAFAGKITNLRIGQGVGNVRLVFESDSDVDYNVFTLSEPNRLVVDVKGVDVSQNVSSNKDENVFVENMNDNDTSNIKR